MADVTANFPVSLTMSMTTDPFITLQWASRYKPSYDKTEYMSIKQSQAFRASQANEDTPEIVIQSPKKLPWPALIRLAFLEITNLLFFMGCSQIMPFFPAFALQHDMDETATGWMLGLYYLAMAFFYSFFSTQVDVVGPTFLLWAGLLSYNGALILFGSLQFFPNGTVFIVFSFILRFVQAIGHTSFITVVYPLAASWFEPRLQPLVFSILEATASLGYCVGPLLGSALISAFQFFGSLLFISCVMVVFGAISLIYIRHHIELPELEKEAPQKKTETSRAKKQLVKSAMKSFKFWELMLFILTISILATTIQPVLSLSLIDYYGLDPEDVLISIGFLFSSLFYCISALAIGKTISNYDYIKRYVNLVAFILSTVCFLVIARWTNSGIWTIIMMNATIQVAVAGVMVCGPGIMITILLDTVQKQGLDDFITQRDLLLMAFTFYNVAFCFGSWLGPTIAGAMYQNYGLSILAWYGTVFSGLMFLVRCVTFALELREGQRKVAVSNEKNRVRSVSRQPDVVMQSSITSYGATLFKSSERSLGV